MNNLYGGLKKVKARRGKEHEFLGMILRYSDDGKLHVHMERHVEDMIGSGPKNKDSGKIALTPAAKNLFSEDVRLKKLNVDEKEAFHSCVMLRHDKKLQES